MVHVEPQTVPRGTRDAGAQGGRNRRPAPHRRSPNSVSASTPGGSSHLRGEWKAACWRRPAARSHPRSHPKGCSSPRWRRGTTWFAAWWAAHRSTGELPEASGSSSVFTTVSNAASPASRRAPSVDGCLPDRVVSSRPPTASGPLAYGERATLSAPSLRRRMSLRPLGFLPPVVTFPPHPHRGRGISADEQETDTAVWTSERIELGAPRVTDTCPRCLSRTLVVEDTRSRDSTGS